LYLLEIIGDMNVKIREFKPEDTRAILEIHQENEMFFEDIEISEEFILHISNRSDFKIFVADDFSYSQSSQNSQNSQNSPRENVVGFVGVLFHPKVGRAEIGPIVVKRECRNQNIGKQLISFTLEFLKNQHIHRVVSKVKTRNVDAIKFFNHLGFNQEAKLKNYTKKKEDVMQLVKFL
jgi:ribosomal protein S18 acetylase RimI-like enzyme